MNEKDIEAYERGRKAVIDEAVEIAEKLRKQTSPMHDAHQFYQVKDYNQALDDTIKALQDKK